MTHNAPEQPDPDRTRGLYSKFTCTREDGQDLDGGQHHDCPLFCVDEHDQFFLPTARAYAEAVQKAQPWNYPTPPYSQEEAYIRLGHHQFGWTVERVDGSSGPGHKHHGCRYLVLDLIHGGPQAFAALEAYRLACADVYPRLAADLGAMLRGEVLPNG